MAHTVSEVSELVTKCNQLSKEVLELRQEQENRATEIQKRDAQISELKGMIKLLQRGASSIDDSESRLTLEKDTLLAANQNLSRELNDRMGKIRHLQAEVEKTRLNGDEVKGQLTSLRSEVTVANERIQQLETENAKLKADLNVANKRIQQLTEDAKLKADLNVSNERTRQLETEDAKLKADLNVTNEHIYIQQLETENAQSKGVLNAARPKPSSPTHIPYNIDGWFAVRKSPWLLAIKAKRMQERGQRLTVEKRKK